MSTTMYHLKDVKNFVDEFVLTHQQMNVHEGTEKLIKYMKEEKDFTICIEKSWGGFFFWSIPGDEEWYQKRFQQF